MDDVTEAVKGRWPGILKTLGVKDEYLTNRNGPCPFCGGKDRYTFTDFNGDGVWLCRGCGNGDGWKFVMNWFKWSFRESIEHIEPLVGLGKIEKVEQVPKRDPIPALKKIAGASRTIPSGSVYDYLMSRGFEDPLPEGLRQADLSYYHEGNVVGTYSTLVSLIQDWQGNGVSYHLTYTENGQKADLPVSRKIMPPKGTITGAAVRLNVDFEERICVAEGIETAYAAFKDSGEPAFATLTAHGMETFIPPEGVKTVFIYSDNDLSYTGQAAAYSLAKRLRLKGLETFVLVPDKIGQDWSDVLMEKKRRAEGANELL